MPIVGKPGLHLDIEPPTRRIACAKAERTTQCDQRGAVIPSLAGTRPLVSAVKLGRNRHSPWTRMTARQGSSGPMAASSAATPGPPKWKGIERPHTGYIFSIELV
jgi:hypothetical protein